MSERRIGDIPKCGYSAKANTTTDQRVAYHACKGAPVSIKHGCVVALTEALEHILLMQTRGFLVVGEEATKQARAALALYSGAGCAE